MLLNWTTILRRLIFPAVAFLVWAPAAHAWSWPVQGPVARPFVYDESHPYASGQHRGIDIGADATGATVVAPADGLVSFAGTVPTNGMAVTIETPDGYSVTLTHLGSIAVAKGASLAEGDAVGTVGPSGTPEGDGPYVHLGIRVTADENGYVDPLSLLPQPTETGGSETGSGSPATQPVSNGASSSTAPAPQPAPAAPAAPAARGQGTILQARPTRVSHHTRSRTSQPETRAQGSLQRARVPQPASAVHETKHRRPAQHPRVSEPMSASRRPVVEAETPGELSDLDTGHETTSSPRANLATPLEGHTPSALLALALNGGAALVAVGAAIAAARRRHSDLPRALGGAEVIRLPTPSPEPRAQRAA